MFVVEGIYVLRIYIFWKVMGGIDKYMCVFKFDCLVVCMFV